MIRFRIPALALLLLLATAQMSTTARASSGATGAPDMSGVSGGSGGSDYCDQARMTVNDQDRLLRFAAVVRDELEVASGDAALISRSGLDLSRFGIRYSHAAVITRSDDHGWNVRQLYFACDQRRPQLYDQGLAGFAMGTNDRRQGYVSVVLLPAAAALRLKQAVQNNQQALQLLAERYSANAYAYGLTYQNCNQWVIEMMALAWGDVAPPLTRESAQRWLRDAGYAPQPVEVNSGWLMLAAYFVPALHFDDHPAEDRSARQLKISLPTTLEAFVQRVFPDSQRIEICHTDQQVVVHRGWQPMADGCQPQQGDRVVALD